MSKKPESKSLMYPLLMWGLLALFYVYQYIARSSIPTTLTDNIMLHYMLDSAGVGALLGCYYYAYTAMQIPAGILLDKFGTRYTSAISMFICAVGLYIFIATSNYYVGAVGQILIGVGSAFAVLALFKCTKMWFAPSQGTIMTSISAAFGPIGPVCAGPMIAMAARSMDWKDLILYFSMLGVGLALLIFAVVRDKDSSDSTEADISVLEGIKIILKSPQIWLLSIYIMGIYSPISALADLWGVSFVKTTYEVDTVKASFASNMIYIGVIIGCPLCGVLANYIKSHKRVLVYSAITAALAFAVLLFCHFSYEVLLVLLFITGLGASGSAIAFVSAMQCVPSKICGITTGFVNTFCMLSGVILQPAIGLFMKLSWDGTVENNLPIYRPVDYITGLTAVLIFLAAAVVSSLFLKETYTD